MRGDPSYVGASLHAGEVTGGSIEINHTNGHPAAGMSVSSWGSGGGYLSLYGSDSGGETFLVRGGGATGTGEPRVDIWGSADEIVFDLSESDSATVRLPTGAINAREILDEPGVSSIQADSWRVLSSSVSTVAARYIDAPSPGYVFISATVVVEFDNRVNQGHYVRLGLSELLNSWSTHAQEFYVSIPGGVYGHYFDTVTVSGIFEIAEGTHTFYLNAQEVAGEVRIGERQFNVLYFPTDHGQWT